MRARRRLWLATGAALGCLLGAGSAAALSSAPGETTTHTVRVPDDTEAWFQVLPIPLCSTPIGCPPPLPIPVPGPATIYPAGTLHVGTALGVEISRTYLRPALFSLPAGAVVTGGVMTVPILDDPKAGTINAADAEITACLASEPVSDGIEGSLEDPPAVDCGISSKGVLTPRGDALTVDLTPFFSAWRDGRQNFGVALLPASGKVGLWQLALKGRSVSPGPHVSFLLTYTLTAPEAVTPPASEPSATPLAPAPPAPVVVPPMVVTTAPPAAPPVFAQPQPVAQVATGFKYSAVFLAPLVFLFGLLFVGRTFTRDATPLNATAGAAKRRH